MKAYLYYIEAITNLQVCSGEENFGVVDNLIQRDITTKLPVIHASSLKGAIREHLESLKNNSEMIKKLFGSKPIENEANNMQAGSLRFFDAHLLAIPVRCKQTPYLMATCPKVLNEYIDFIQMFGLENKYVDVQKILIYLEDLYKKRKEKNKNIPNYTVDKYSGILIEDLNSQTELISQSQLKDSSDQIINFEPLTNLLKELIGDNCVLMSNENFSLLCDDNHLPIIARNYLIKGESKNLWYEQVLPRKSKLYFFVYDTQSQSLPDLSTQLVQIGANASVGYGFCKITKK